MKTFSTFLIIFGLLVTKSLAVHYFVYVPEQQIVDSYGNKVIIQDGYVDWQGLPNELAVWLLDENGKWIMPYVFVCQNNKTQEKIELLVKNTDYLHLDICPGEWTIKTYLATSQGKKKKEISSFKWTVEVDRDVLARVYLK